LSGPNAYSQSTNTFTTGNSGAGGCHLDYIIAVDGVPIDAQCATGTPAPGGYKYGKSSDHHGAACPITGQPVNLCDGENLDALLDQVDKARNGVTKGPCLKTADGTDNCPADGSGYGSTDSTTPDLPPEANDSPEWEGDIRDYQNQPFDPVGGSDDGQEDDPPLIYLPDGPEGEEGDPADIVPPPSGDGPQELSSCAADIWTGMVNQAMMQSRREDIMNKRYIVKPDSVLQYSCFNDDMRSIIDDAGPIFSSSRHWENLKVDLLGPNGSKREVTIKIYKKDLEFEEEYLHHYLSPTTLEESLVLVVDSVWTNYRNRQFNHDYLSGTAPTGEAKLGPCANMANIWRAAKCKNFDDTTIFYRFEQLAGSNIDPREFPTEMKCGS
jgi:hypothetical protein